MKKIIGSIEIHPLEGSDFYIIQHQNNMRNIKMGKREVSFLLETLGAKDIMEQEDAKAYPEFQEKEKEYMLNKFKQWGFIEDASNQIELSFKRKILNKLANIRLIRLKSINLDNFLSQKMHIINFLLSPYVVVSSIILFIISLFVLSIKGEHLLQYSSEELLKSVNFLLLIPMQFLTIFIHELYHGISCKYYGGKTPEIGFMLYYLFPVMYCNTNDVYTFKSRKSKAFVALAGIYSNIVLAGIALLVFSLLIDRNILCMTLLVYGTLNIGIVTFNLIPFVKFDGYWLLCSILNITNLMDKSFTLFLSLLFSFKSYRAVHLKPRRKIFLTVYGGISAFFDIIFWAFSIRRFYEYLYPVLEQNTIYAILLLIILVTYSVVSRWWKEIKGIFKERNKVLYVNFN